MPAYIVAIVDVKNAEAYAEYSKLAGPAMLKYGGRFLARGGACEVFEGAFPGRRVVIAEYESIEKARAFYNSPEYQAARQKRLGSANFNMLVVDGA